MKINKWFFLFLMVLLVINSSTALYFLVIKNPNYKNVINALHIKTPSPNFTDYKSGLTPDGQVFVSASGLTEGDSVFCAFTDPKSCSTETITMKKYGNFYFGKPNKTYEEASLYFFQKNKKIPWGEFKKDDSINQSIINFCLEKDGRITLNPN